MTEFMMPSAEGSSAVSINDIDISSFGEKSLGFKNRRTSLSLMAGWGFIRCRAGEEDSLPVSSVRGFCSPMIQYNPKIRSIEYLENPVHALDWLSFVMRDFCYQVLISACKDKETYIGSLTGRGWDQFREAIVEHTGETMEDLVKSVVVKGFQDTLDHIVDCVYVESGLHTALIARASGRPVLVVK